MWRAKTHWRLFKVTVQMVHSTPRGASYCVSIGVPNACFKLQCAGHALHAFLVGRITTVSFSAAWLQARVAGSCCACWSSSQLLTAQALEQR